MSLRDGGDAAAPAQGMPRLGAALRRVSPAGLIAALVLGGWMVALVGAPLLAQHGPADITAAGGFAPPSAAHWLGTDYLGRDLWSRLLFGARSTIGLGLVATCLAFALGASLGFVAGLRGGRVDSALSRGNDVLLSFPAVVIALLVIAGLGASNLLVVLTTGLIYATGVFRIARACCRGVAALPYVEVARLRGEGTAWLLWREVLPNVAGPLSAEFGLRFAFTILFISGLSFVGLGIQPPDADWGVMVRENLTGLHLGSLAPVLPALAIASITVSLNLIVDEFGSRRLEADQDLLRR
jgi:peptide/nickel transport system permease protein